MNNRTGMKTAVSVSTTDALKGLDFRLFETVIAGNSFCHKIPGNAASPEKIKETLEILGNHPGKGAVAMPVAPLEKEIPNIRRCLDEISKQSHIAVEVQSHAMAQMIRSNYPSIRILFGPFALVHTTFCAAEMQNMEVAGGTPPPELEGRETAAILRETSMDIYLPVLGHQPVSFSQDCHLSPYAKTAGKCSFECTDENIITFDESSKVIQKGRALYSHKCLNLLEYMDSLISMGFTCFRMEGLLWDSDKINQGGQVIRQMQNSPESYPDLKEKLMALSPQGFCNGFFFGQRGIDYLDRDSGRGYFDRSE